MKTAALIERRPDLFNFGTLIVPENECGTPGCLIGWINYFTGTGILCTTLKGFEGRRLIWGCDLLQVNDMDFYNRLTEFEDWWRLDAKKAARALRLYARLYLPTTVVETTRTSTDTESAHA